MILSSRLKKENAILSNSCTVAKFLKQTDSSQTYKGFVQSPPTSAYRGHYFEISVSIPTDYPYTAPKVNFITTIYHPNIDIKTGEVCVDILKNAWKPMMTLNSILDVIIELLAHPNSESPLNCDAALLIREGEIEVFEQLAELFCTNCCPKINDM